MSKGKPAHETGVRGQRHRDLLLRLPPHGAEECSIGALPSPPGERDLAGPWIAFPFRAFDEEDIDRAACSSQDHRDGSLRRAWRFAKSFRQRGDPTRIVRQTPQASRENLGNRGHVPRFPVLENAIRWDKEWREGQQELDRLRHRRNVITDEIRELKKAGGGGGPQTGRAAE